MPIIFTLGKFQVFTFGLFLALGFILSSFVVFYFGREDLKEEEYMDAFVYSSLMALFGARLMYVLTHFADFGGNILRYIVVREEPGLSLFGGLLGGTIFLWYYTKRRKIEFIRLADIFSVAFSFGLSIVSFGSFIGGGTYGAESFLPVGVKVVEQSSFIHPVELYQGIILLILFILLATLLKTFFRRKEGLVSLVFLLGLSVSIFLLEFLKSIHVYLYYQITFNHLISFSLFSACIVYILYLMYRRKKGIK
ncbi:prolipoprotein diacylglyceryl transferase [Candidatus Gottesmanbacteria bacterium]|nr:prolipoprotein diacylglyceryl transferase [Candidatus Gottesmanbacteria bacterium]